MEISAMLRQQLGNVSTKETQLEEVGTVPQVGDGIARVWDFLQVKAGSTIYQTSKLLPKLRTTWEVVLMGFWTKLKKGQCKRPD